MTCIKRSAKLLSSYWYVCVYYLISYLLALVKNGVHVVKLCRSKNIRTWCGSCTKFFVFDGEYQNSGATVPQKHRTFSIICHSVFFLLEFKKVEEFFPVSVLGTREIGKFFLENINTFESTSIKKIRRNICTFVNTLIHQTEGENCKKRIILLETKH